MDELVKAAQAKLAIRFKILLTQWGFSVSPDNTWGAWVAYGKNIFNAVLQLAWPQPLPVNTEVVQEHSDSEKYDNIVRHIYVSPRAKQMAAQADFLLEAAMENFLADSTQRIAVILGDPGAGKSTFAKHWLASCFKKYEQAIHKKQAFLPPLPVFMSLNEVVMQKNTNPTAILYGYFRSVGLDDSQIDLLKMLKVPLIVFCDGYDEISHNNNLYQDNRWSEWPQVKFVVATRPEKFGWSLNVTELQEIVLKTFSPYKNNYNGVSVYHLQDFNEQDIRLYISQWKILGNSDWDVETYFNKLQQIPGLFELSSNPIILSLVLFTLPSLVKNYTDTTALSFAETTEQKHFERVNVYDFFVEEWFKQQAKKVRKKLEELNKDLFQKIGEFIKSQRLELTDDIINDELAAAINEYTIQLGYWCLRYGVDGKLRIEIPVQETLKMYLLPKKYQTLQLTAQETVQFLIALRSGCLLRCDIKNFKFFHKSLVEYFAQSHIFKGKVGRLTSIADCAGLMAEMEDLNLLKLLAERAKANQAFRDYLYLILRESKHRTDIGIAAANAITILNQAKQPLNQESWQGIRIPGADLSYANLHGGDLRGADLSGVNFNHAYLREADLSGSNLRGCKWSSPAKFSFDSHVQAVEYFEGKPWLVVGEKKGKVHLVDIQTGLIKQTLWHYKLVYFESDELVGLATDGSSTHTTQWIVSVAKNDKIYLWKLIDNKFVEHGVLQHPGVTCIAISANGQRLVSGHTDRKVRVWNVNLKEMLTFFQGHNDEVTSVAISADGERIVSGDRGGKVRVWGFDVLKDRLITFSGHNDEIKKVGISSDGEQVISSDINNLIVWKKVSQVVARKFWFQLWSEKSTEAMKILPWHNQDTQATSGKGNVAFNFDRQQIASIGSGGDLYVQDLTEPSNKIVAIFPTDVWYWQDDSFAISRNGKQIVSSNSCSINLWDIESYREVKTLSNNKCLSINLDGKRIVTEGKNGILHVWDLNSQQILASVSMLPEKRKWYDDIIIALSADGQRVVVWCEDNSNPGISIGDIALQKIIATLPNQTGSTIKNISISSDGQQVGWGQEDGCIQVWDVASQVALTSLLGHTGAITSLIFSNNASLIISGSTDETVRVWDIMAKTELIKLVGHIEGVKNILLNNNNEKIVTQDNNGNIFVWDIRSGKKLVTLNGCSSTKVIALSTNEAQIATGSYNEVYIWDVVKQSRLQKIHVTFDVKGIVFLADKLKIYGFIKSALQVLIYKYQNNHYYLYDYWYHPNELGRSSDLHTAMNINATVGLTANQQSLLLNQHAIGKAATLSYFDDTDAEVLEDKKYFHQLKNIQISLKNHSKTQTQVPSIFNSTTTISYSLWMLYLYRVTKPIGTEAFSRSSQSNRHVYGIVEGLDQLNRRMLIRFDLVEDSKQKSFGLVKVKIIEMDDHNIAEGKKGFIELCHNDKYSDPEEIACFTTGILKVTQLDNLFGRILDEMQRQFQYDESKRILYRFRGGDEYTSESHNCLTWLRYLLKDFEKITIPRSAFDFFAANPENILPASGGFFRAPEGVSVVNTKDWTNSAIPSLSNSL